MEQKEKHEHKTSLSWRKSLKWLWIKTKLLHNSRPHHLHIHSEHFLHLVWDPFPLCCLWGGAERPLLHEPALFPFTLEGVQQLLGRCKPSEAPGPHGPVAWSTLPPSTPSSGNPKGQHTHPPSYQCPRNPVLQSPTSADHSVQHELNAWKNWFHHPASRQTTAGLPPVWLQGQTSHRGRCCCLFHSSDFCELESQKGHECIDQSYSITNSIDPSLTHAPNTQLGNHNAV